MWRSSSQIIKVAGCSWNVLTDCEIKLIFENFHESKLFLCPLMFAFQKNAKRTFGLFIDLVKDDDSKRIFLQVARITPRGGTSRTSILSIKIRASIF